MIDVIDSDVIKDIIKHSCKKRVGYKNILIAGVIYCIYRKIYKNLKLILQFNFKLINFFIA